MYGGLLCMGNLRFETRNKEIKKTKYYGFVLMILTIEKTMAV
jgi:hypothetical protein